jgi:anti-anti-sigma factor
VRVVVRLSGDLDLAAFDAVEEMLANAQSNGNRCVRIDLRGLEFIDSTGKQSSPGRPHMG